MNADRNGRTGLRRRRQRRKRNARILLAAAAVAAVWLLYKPISEKARTINYDKARQVMSEEGYPSGLLDLYERNEEAREFVRNYRYYDGCQGEIDVSKDLEENQIPLFLQWDERWGYEFYGNNFLAVTGCGPTALAMVYCGLTGDASMNPLELARQAEKEGYYVEGSGSSWSLMSEFAEELGLTVENIRFEKEDILSQLHAGHPVICIMGPGDFTTSGHFIVLTEATKEDKVIVHDPNSILNSEKEWDVEVLMGQMKNLWSYSKS